MRNTTIQPKQDQKNQQPTEQKNQQQKSQNSVAAKKQVRTAKTGQGALSQHEQEHPETRMTR